MSKHTPGPWSVSEFKKIFSTNPMVTRGVGYYVHVATVESQPLDQTEDANAALIAAAPDMLAELVKAHKIIRNALALMTPEQRDLWAGENDKEGLIGDSGGTTRASERTTVCEKAGFKGRI